MEKFDIYWYDFVYEENKGESKVRPVLVLDVDVILPIAKITSCDIRTAKDYRILNWKEAGLTKPSVIRFDKNALILKSSLSDSGYIGHLAAIDIDKIKTLHLVENLEEELDDPFGIFERYLCD